MFGTLKVERNQKFVWGYPTKFAPEASKITGLKLNSNKNP
jgi:hypothetical protein